MKKYFKKIFVLFFAVMLFLPFVVKADETFTVTFDTQGGTEIPNQTVENGGVVVKPEDPTNGNLEFVKWVINNYDNYDFSTPVTSDLTIQAMWRVKVKAYTYPANAGIIYFGNNPETGTVGEFETSWTIPNLNMNGGLYQQEKEGYVFKEWRVGSKDGVVIGKDTSVFPYEYNGSITFKLNDNYVFYAIYERTEVDTPIVSISANNNKLTLNWEKQPVAEKAVVYRSTNNKTWKKLDTITTNTYTDKSLTYGKTYYYKVKVYGKGHWSSYSKVVSKKVVPNKVKNLKIKSANTNTVKLEWDKVSVSGYAVYRSTDNKTWSKVKTITKNTTVYYNDAKLKANKRYYYKVRAYKTVSGSKVYGKYSDVITIKTAPEKPGVEMKKYSFTELKLIFNFPKGTKYIKAVQSYDNFKNSIKSDYISIDEIPSSVIVPAPTGKTVYFKLKTCNSDYICSKWVVISQKVIAPGPKLELKSTKAKQVNLKVTINEYEFDGFEFYRSKSLNGKYELVKEINKGTDSSQYSVGAVDENKMFISFNDKTKSNVTYYYKVRTYILLDNGKKLYSKYSGVKKIKSK